jgi:hypothetical protein
MNAWLSRESYQQNHSPSNGRNPKVKIQTHLQKRRRKRSSKRKTSFLWKTTPTSKNISKRIKLVTT